MMDRKMNLMEVLKDKASILRATFSLNRHVSSIHVAVLRATTHDPLSPPSESRLAAVLDLGTTSRLAACRCIDIVMDRLHVTQNAFVALKCLHVIHIVVSRGSAILRDQVSYHPSFGGHNYLNMTTFTDKSDMDTWRYSSWVRWYAAVVEQRLISAREIGYYIGAENKKSVKNNVDVFKNSDLVADIEALVEFVARVGDAPEESLGLRRNDLVYEIVKAAGEDYRAVQAEISARVADVDDRVPERLSLSEMGRVVDALKRLEDCKERLTLLFVNRKKNEVFWEKVRKTREKVAEVKAQREEKRLVVVSSGSSNKRGGELDGGELTTQWWNPFLEPGQLLSLPSSSGGGGGGWLGMGPSPIAV